MTAQTIIPPTGSYRYGLFMDRFLALLIDIILLSIVYIAVLFPLSILTALFALGTPFILAAGPGNHLFLLVLYWLYFAGLESGARGGTIGKRAMKLRVVGEDGAPISFGRASLRFLFKIVSAWPLLLGFVMALFTSKKQALHDLVAQTIVIEV